MDNLIHGLTINRIVIDRLFILPSAALHDSPAYLFATGSAPVLSDSGASWADYILSHLSNRFTAYALRLTMLLLIAFGLGFPLQTEFPLYSPLIIHGLPDNFTMDDIIVATHLSHNDCSISQLLQSLQNKRKLLFLSQTDGQHRLEVGNTMPLRLKISQLVQHKPRLIQRLLITNRFTCSQHRLCVNSQHGHYSP